MWLPSNSFRILQGCTQFKSLTAWSIRGTTLEVPVLVNNSIGTSRILLIAAVFVMPMLVEIIFQTVIRAGVWLAVGLTLGAVALHAIRSPPGINHHYTPSNVTPRFGDTNPPKKKLVLVLVGCCAFVLFVISRTYFVNGMIPVGWDTGQHLYRARLIIDGDIEEMLNLSGGNSFLIYFLLALASLYDSSNLFAARIVLVLMLASLIVSVTFIVAKRRYGDQSAPMMAATVAAVWFSTYRLSADLHKTLLALILLLPLALLYDAEDVTWSKRAQIGFLALCISFTQIEIAILLIGCAFLCEVFRLSSSGLSRWRAAIGRVLTISAPCIPALVLALSYSSRFVTVGIAYETMLSAPDLLSVFYSFGAFLLPLTVVGLLTYLASLKSNREAIGFLEAFTLIVVFMIVLPSFVLEQPPLFRKMALRSMTILPLPLIIVDGMRAVKKRTREVSFRFLSFPVKGEILPWAFAALIIVTSVNVPYMASMHHTPFITPEAISELVALSEVDLGGSAVFLTWNAYGSQYRDDGWAGAYIGNHYAWNGPLVYLLTGIAYPFKDAYNNVYSANALARLVDAGISFPINSTEVQIATTNSFYGPLTPEEELVAIEIASGSYIFDAGSRDSLLLNYSHSPGQPFDYEGDWAFYSYSLLVTDSQSGGEFIIYPLLLSLAGNYSLVITYKSPGPSFSDVELWLNDSSVGLLDYNYTSREMKWISYHQSVGSNLLFLKLASVQHELPAFICIRSISIVKV